jgi:hypothetical protein
MLVDAAIATPPMRWLAGTCISIAGAQPETASLL